MLQSCSNFCITRHYPRFENCYPYLFSHTVYFVLQRVAWTVAALVIVINGYLLLDFFIAEVNGLLFGFVVCTGTAAYVAFIVYLISYGGGLPSSLFNLIRTKGFGYTRT